jgi:arylsulfatase A-like enzyme
MQRFTGKPETSIALLFGSLLISFLLGGCSSPPYDPPEGKNILILMAEDMSPRVGAFGDPVAVTPAIDRLAAEGVRYPNTFTAAGVCAPSRAALITGVHPMAIGAQHMRSMDGGYLAVPPPAVKAFPEILRREGYCTFTDHKLDYQFSETLAGTGPFTIWDAEGFGTGWRDCPQGKPFVGLINFQATHESAVFPRSGPPKNFLHLVFRIYYTLMFLGHEDVVEPEQVVIPPYYPDTPTVRADMARHYNNINFMDKEVAEIRNRLERDGLAESTIILWATDHGDGLPRAKREIYDSGIRVPMIVYWPPSLRPSGVQPGTVDEQLVSFVDLAPTVLGLLGIPPPDYMVGRSFIEAAESSPSRQYIYAAKDRMDESLDRQRGVRDARFKYIRNYHAGEPGALPLEFRENLDMMEEMRALYREGSLDEIAARWFEPRPPEELYDTVADPHEIDNLADDPAHTDTLERLRGVLDQWLDETPDLGAIPEEELRDSFWPGGTQPVTQAPSISVEGKTGSYVVCLSSETDGASIGYRLHSSESTEEQMWSLYTGSFSADSGDTVEAKAVRYGWAESEVIMLQVP